MNYVSIKRLLDIGGVVLLLPFVAPFFSVLLLMHRVLINGELFFMQERLGRDKRTFMVYKIRTMEKGKLLSNWTSFLRNSHMDEIPQLFNILRGEMSFVGPRPLLKSYFPYFTPSENKRFMVKPGLTGLSQVCGGNQLSWNERLLLDVRYAFNCSIFLDTIILVKTLRVLFALENTSSITLIEERTV